MDFVLDAGVAKTTLTRLYESAPSKTKEGSLVGVLVEACDDNTIRFSVNEGGVIVRDVASATVKAPGASVVDLISFYRAVSSLSPFDIETGLGTTPLKIRKGTQSLTVSYKTFYSGSSVSSKRTIKLLDVAVPKLQIISPDNFIRLPIATVTAGFRKVLFSASTEATSSGFSGVLLDISKSEIKFVSINGVCLTELVAPIVNKNLSTSCVLDSTLVSRLYRSLAKLQKGNDGGEVDILITDRMFLFQYESFMIGVSSSVADFPDYSSLLSIKRKYFVLDSEVLLDNIRNVMFSSDKNDDFRITLHFHGSELSIKTESCENEGIKLHDGTKGNLCIDFNVHLLEGCIKNIESGLTSFAYKDRHSPVIIKPVELDSVKSLFSILAPLK